MPIKDVIATLNKGLFSDNITYRWKTNSKDAKLTGFPIELNKELVEILNDNGYQGLFEHQKQCFYEILNGKNVILNTGTSSGKTLSYNLPIIHHNLSINEGHTLYLFPTKALAADQLIKINIFLKSLNKMGHSFFAEKLDGDTPSHKRTAMRNTVNFLFTNPDMLHLGILPHHTLWEHFLYRLKFVVIDEVHSYRGVLGSHFSNLIRRLKRILAFYDTKPRYILTSATISNAKEFANKLICEEFSLINDDNYEQGERNYFFYNPPIIDQELGLRSGMLNESVPILDLLTENNNQTIVFVRSRKTVESSIRMLKGHFSESTIQIHGYRSGFLAKERRSIEDGLREGIIDLVISTNAMELGIDMGKVDAILILGYPGSIASFMQQSGRAGRNNNPSVILLMASSLPIDQFIIRHPEFIQGKSHEKALINPDNDLILFNHLKCAIYELPFNAGDCFGNLPWEYIKQYLDICLLEKYVIEKSGKYFWVADNYPANFVSLRSINGQPIKLFLDSNGKPKLIGEIDSKSAKKFVFPGAVYSHNGNTFVVNDLDLEGNVADLVPDDGIFYTEPKIESQIEILEIRNKQEYKNYIKYFGEIRIREKVTGYSKYDWQTREIIKTELIDLPSEDLVTSSCWISFNDNFVESLRQKGQWLDDPINYGDDWNKIRNQVKIRDNFRCKVCGKDEKNTILHVHHIVPFKKFLSSMEANSIGNLVTLCPNCHNRAEIHVKMRSGLGGLAYIMTNLAPIFLMCASRDLGSYFDASPKYAERKPIILFYDLYSGGIGLAIELFDIFEKILSHSIDFIINCPCSDGCPSCVGPAGENGASAKSITLETIKLLLTKNE